MVEPRKELRTWRAWACWALACRIFPELPADQEQIYRESVIEPGVDKIAERLGVLGVAGEDGAWMAQHSQLLG